MCYYNQCKVTRAEFIRLKDIEKEIRNLKLNRSVQNGFDYRDWPLIKPLAGGKDFEIIPTHWEYIPSFIHDSNELGWYRTQYSWLNAKNENLFVNEKGKLSIYREGALNGRCLALSTGFFEWRHIPKLGKKGQVLKATDKIPYFITTADEEEYFFMAAVSRIWTNHERGQSADTFSIVTGEANEFMASIHNTKKRMPIILPSDLAFEWIQEGLTEQRIKEIASYRIPAQKLIGWPVARDFLKQKDPSAPFHYENLPEL